MQPRNWVFISYTQIPLIEQMLNSRHGLHCPCTSSLTTRKFHSERSKFRKAEVVVLTLYFAHYQRYPSNRGTSFDMLPVLQQAMVQRFCPEGEAVHMNRDFQRYPQRSLLCLKHSMGKITSNVMLYIKTSELIHLITEGLYSLTNIFHSPALPHSW